MKEPFEVPKKGTKLRVVKLGDTRGMLVKRECIDNRKCDEIVQMFGVVPGHGGDVLWCKHADGNIAAYCFSELELIDALKPCPFCGSADVIIHKIDGRDNRDYWKVECNGCDVCIKAGDGTRKTQIVAANEWNTRAETPELRAIRKALEFIVSSRENAAYDPDLCTGLYQAQNIIIEQLLKEGVTL